MSDDVEAVQACLRDDAATLRDDNKECEIASNMDAAATLIGRLTEELAAANEARDQAKVDLASREQDAWRAGYDFAKLHFYDIPLRNRDEMFSHLAGALKDRAVLRTEVERLRDAHLPLQKTLCVNVSCNHCKRSLLAVGCCDRKCDEAGQLCGLRPLLTAVVPAIDAARPPEPRMLFSTKQDPTNWNTDPDSDAAMKE